jgi:hypothetical protein
MGNSPSCDANKCSDVLNKYINSQDMKNWLKTRKNNEARDLENLQRLLGGFSKIDNAYIKAMKARGSDQLATIQYFGKRKHRRSIKINKKYKTSENKTYRRKKHGSNIYRRN